MTNMRYDFWAKTLAQKRVIDKMYPNLLQNKKINIVYFCVVGINWCQAEKWAPTSRHIFATLMYICTVCGPCLFKVYICFQESLLTRFNSHLRILIVAFAVVPVFDIINIIWNVAKKIFISWAGVKDLK